MARALPQSTHKGEKKQTNRCTDSYVTKEALGNHQLT